MDITNLQIDTKRVFKTTLVCFLTSFVVCILDWPLLAPILFALSIPLSNYDLVKRKATLGMIVLFVLGVFFGGFFLGFFLRGKLKMGPNGEVLSGVICSILIWVIVTYFLPLKNKVLSLLATLVLSTIAFFIVEPLQQNIFFFQKIDDPGTIFVVWQTFVGFAISLGFRK